MSGAGVVLEGVCKRYGQGPQGVAALSDLTLTIPPRQFLSVMGPSGSGKSTMLNVIAGLDAPTEGRVVLSDRDLATLSDDECSDMRLRQIGFVFQTFNLFPGFTVEENVLWPLRFLGVAWRVARQRAAVTLQQVGIGAGAHRRRPAELSGGEQQRVAIARALVTEPRLLLADEPTGNLDSRTGQAVLDLLLNLNADRGLTVVLVTHSTFAATYGHRTIELQDGRMIRDAQAPTKIGRVVPINA